MRTLIAVIAAVMLAGCGHLANQAPPKVETASTKDSNYTCEDINSEIRDLRIKMISTQKQLDLQINQNILSGIGGWFLIVPFVFIDPTTDKNAAYNSYADREKYLRQVAGDRGCVINLVATRDYSDNTCLKWKCTDPKYKVAFRVYPDWSETNNVIKGPCKLRENEYPFICLDESLINKGQDRERSFKNCDCIN